MRCALPQKSLSNNIHSYMYNNSDFINKIINFIVISIIAILFKHLPMKYFVIMMTNIQFL